MDYFFVHSQIRHIYTFIIDKTVAGCKKSGGKFSVICVSGMSCKSCVFKREGEAVHDCRLNEFYRLENANYIQLIPLLQIRFI